MTNERAHSHVAEHADGRAAEELLAQGESPRDTALPVAEHAAWAQVAALLLNLSETMTKN